MFYYFGFIFLFAVELCLRFSSRTPGFGFCALCLPTYMEVIPILYPVSVVNSYFFHGDDDADDDVGSVVFPSRKCAPFG